MGKPHQIPYPDENSVHTEITFNGQLAVLDVLVMKSVDRQICHLIYRIYGKEQKTGWVDILDVITWKQYSPHRTQSADYLIYHVIDFSEKTKQSTKLSGYTNWVENFLEEENMVIQDKKA